MANQLARDYVWECDYGEREPLIPTLKTLLDEQDSSSLQMITLMANNNIYSLEFFIVVSYVHPLEGHIYRMKELLREKGIRYRPDITFDELITEEGKKRFNSTSLVSSLDVESALQSSPILFQFLERKAVEKKISMRPLGKTVPVFLSHTSRDKPVIEDLIPFLNAAELPIWYDDINIDYGESIVGKIQEGIEDSGAVIFWITNEFLQSHWCQTEMRSFLARQAGKNNVLILPVINEGVDQDRLPPFIKDIKYLRITKGNEPEQVVHELIPTLKRYFGID